MQYFNWKCLQNCLTVILGCLFPCTYNYELNIVQLIYPVVLKLQWFLDFHLSNFKYLQYHCLILAFIFTSFLLCLNNHFPCIFVSSSFRNETFVLWFFNWMVKVLFDPVFLKLQRMHSRWFWRSKVKLSIVKKSLNCNGM